MNRFKFILTATLIFALGFGFNSCKEDDDNEPEKINTEQTQTSDGTSTEKPSEEQKTESLTVDFNLLDGSGTASSQKVEKGQKITLPSGEDFKKEGYVFKGWSLTENGEIISEYTVTDEDVTFFAVWNQLFKIEFDTDDGTEDVETQFIEKGDKAVKPEKDPKKNGYIFRGWYLNDVKYNFETTVKSELTLKAKWEAGYLFSVSETKQVIFSPGNLQYNTITQEFQFANRQTEYIGADQTTIIDLFSFGTWLDGTDKANIVKTLENCENYSPALNADKNFAKNQTTINGTKWFTLSCDEWMYLINKSKMKLVDNSFGLIILPDECSYTVNDIAKTDWSDLEAAGAVFLPASGHRNSTGVNSAGLVGLYSTSTASDDSKSYGVSFFFGTISKTEGQRYFGLAVRLVRSLQD